MVILGAVNGQRHKAACHVQDAMNTIVPAVEHRLKGAATVIAKTLTSKVTSYYNVVVSY